MPLPYKQYDELKKWESKMNDLKPSLTYAHMAEKDWT